jgi:NAD(P)H-binding
MHTEEQLFYKISASVICKIISQSPSSVISTLGQSKGESPIFSAATANVLRAMGEYGVKRYILTTGLNVDTPWDKKGARTSAATEWMKANYAATTTDKQLEYSLLAESDVEWTLVRLPLIAQLVEIAHWRKSPFLANILATFY